MADLSSPAWGPWKAKGHKDCPAEAQQQLAALDKATEKKWDDLYHKMKGRGQLPAEALPPAKKPRH